MSVSFTVLCCYSYPRRIFRSWWQYCDSYFNSGGNSCTVFSCGSCDSPKQEDKKQKTYKVRNNTTKIKPLMMIASWTKKLLNENRDNHIGLALYNPDSINIYVYQPRFQAFPCAHVNCAWVSAMHFICVQAGTIYCYSPYIYMHEQNSVLLALNQYPTHQMGFCGHYHFNRTFLDW